MPPRPPATPGSGLTFEAFEPGRAWLSPERLVTQSDIDAFAALTGDTNPVHVDATFAARSLFRMRIAHGLLVESLASGLAWQLGIFERTIVALREVTIRFESPVVPGDSIRLELSVLEREPTPGPRRGTVRLRTCVRNQRGELVLDGEWQALVQRAARPPALGPGS
ncbi:MAG: MaoC family dehydratase N-terminal domain-containing protein [Planctomycetes bacterium]|nr:MaoC family dehydratase N-terminal domain-containing protein [Planctomycetota bacterium]